MEAHNIKQAIKHQLKKLLKEQQEETLNHFSEAVLIFKDIMELENFNEEVAHTMRKAMKFCYDFFATRNFASGKIISKKFASENDFQKIEIF